MILPDNFLHKGVKVPRWLVLEVFNGQPSGRVYAMLSGKLSKPKATRIAEDVATVVGAPAMVVMEHRGPKRNPTLVHHGIAQRASFHLVGPSGQPLADLYCSKADALKIAHLFADSYGAQVRLIENWHDRGPDAYRQPYTGVGRKAYLQNPAEAVVFGQVWKRDGSSERLRIVKADGLRAQVTNMATGNRAWIDLDDLRSKYRRQTTTPTRNPKGRNPRPTTVVQAAAAAIDAAGWKAVARQVRTGKATPTEGLAFVHDVEGRPEIKAMLKRALDAVRRTNPSRSKRARASRTKHRAIHRAVGTRTVRAASKAMRRPARPGNAAQALYYLQHHAARSARRKAGLRPNPKGPTAAQMAVVNRLARYAAEYGLVPKGAGFLNGGVVYSDYKDPTKGPRPGGALRAIIFPSGVLQGPSRLIEANSMMLERDATPNPRGRGCPWCGDARGVVRGRCPACGKTRAQARADLARYFAAHPPGGRTPNPKGRKRRVTRVHSNPGVMARARKTFTDWHEFEPTDLVKVKGPDRTIPQVLVGLGEVSAIEYRSDKRDGGRNTTGKVETYRHTTKSPRPILATDPDGKHVHLVGGRMKPTPLGLVH